MIIKIVGGAFHFVNAVATGEGLPVVSYGLFGILSYSILLVQCAHYNKKYHLLLYIVVIPCVPVFLSYYPESIEITNSIKPLAQIASHLAALLVVWNIKSCAGLSLTSQHMNLLGGLLGCYMLWIIPPKSIWTWFSYANSLFQAGTTYIAYVIFDKAANTKVKDTSNKHNNNNKNSNNNNNGEGVKVLEIRANSSGSFDIPLHTKIT
jgi:hypothetical protein